MDFEIRKDRSGGAGRRLTREREVYLQLMSQGYGNAEACRIVGVNRRTGKRWRNGYHSPAYGRPKPPISSTPHRVPPREMRPRTAVSSASRR